MRHGPGPRRRVRAAPRLRRLALWTRPAAYGVKVVNPGGVETLEAGAGKRRGARRCGRSLRSDAPPDPDRAGDGRRRARLAAPDPPPRAEPGPAGQRGDDAGDPAGARRPPGPPGAHPVPQLRRHARRHRAASTRGVARLADYVNTHANLTVDVGQVLFGETTSMTADGAGRPVPPLGHRAEVAQPRCRARDGLRHRADHLRGQELRPRPAVGDRPGVVSERGRPLADRAEHRPPQRGIVPRPIPRSSRC